MFLGRLSSRQHCSLNEYNSQDMKTVMASFYSEFQMIRMVTMTMMVDDDDDGDDDDDDDG